MILIWICSDWPGLQERLGRKERKNEKRAKLRDLSSLGRVRLVTDLPQIGFAQSKLVGLDSHPIILGFHP